MGNTVTKTSTQPSQKEYASTQKFFRRKDLVKNERHCYTGIFGTVYDLHGFLEDHPGGANELFEAAGDIADAFDEGGIHEHYAVNDENHQRRLTPRTEALLSKFKVGTLITEDEGLAPAPAPTSF